MKKFSLALLLALFTGLSGGLPTACGSGDPCVDTCEAGKMCSDQSGITADQDCAAYCSDGRSQAESAGCGSEYDDAIDCVGDIKDPCAYYADDNATECAAESLALVFCVLGSE